jgi:hypothetical protein
MEACYGGTDVMERSCAVARGIDINTDRPNPAIHENPEVVLYWRLCFWSLWHKTTQNGRKKDGQCGACGFSLAGQ